MISLMFVTDSTTTDWRGVLCSMFHPPHLPPPHTHNLSPEVYSALQAQLVNIPTPPMPSHARKPQPKLLSSTACPQRGAEHPQSVPHLLHPRAHHTSTQPLMGTQPLRQLLRTGAVP